MGGGNKSVVRIDNVQGASVRWEEVSAELSVLSSQLHLTGMGSCLDCAGQPRSQLRQRVDAPDRLEVAGRTQAPCHVRSGNATWRTNFRRAQMLLAAVRIRRSLRWSHVSFDA